MGSGAIDPTGFSGLRGLMGGGMPDDMIHSFAESTVGGRFEIESRPDEGVWVSAEFPLSESIEVGTL